MENSQHKFSGTHVLAEFFGVQVLVFNRSKLQNAVEKACLAGSAQIIKQEISEFPNGGYTLFALLKESHLSIHTYPEHQAIFLDVFTCGEANSEKIVERLADYYQPTAVNFQTIKRGKQKNESLN